MAKRKSDNKFFTPRTVARGLETLDAYSKRQADKEAARNAVERARRERFRKSCEKGRRFLVNEKILEYWLTQAGIAMSGPKKYWGDTEKYSWPKDKAIVYAVMMICIEQRSIIRIIPDSLKQTECYCINEYVWTWVENFDLSDGFMNYIEAELKSKGLLKRSVMPAENNSDIISNTHSENFRSVTWYGRTYTFNEKQAIAIKLLWEAMERGEGGIHQNTIAESLGTYSKKFRLLDTFRQHGKKHPAWNEMIYCLGHGIYTLRKLG